MSSAVFDPENVNLTSADPASVVCYLQLSGNEYNGHLGERISAIFVILIISTAGTFFPVLAARVPRLKIPLYVYLFARYFGSGVIIATAFIHLLDPAYSEIGPNSCVGMTGNWAVYSWPPAICLTSAMCVFLLDFLADLYVKKKYNMSHGPEIENVITDASRPGVLQVGQDPHGAAELGKAASTDSKDDSGLKILLTGSSEDAELAFKEQIASFLILEFGVLFHSVIIGLNLGVTGNEFFTLYPVLIFHQTFEGLGVGARLSAIPFPSRVSWMPWVLCAAYGLTTPIAIAVGLGLRNTYNGNSYTANIVSGVFDATSAGILVYTGFVEMIARDFIFNPNRTPDKKRLAFMLVCLYAGAGVMALIGKWA